MQDGIEILAAAGGLNEGNHVENGFVGPVPNEVVIGLAAVPLQAEDGDENEIADLMCWLKAVFLGAIEYCRSYAVLLSYD